MAALKLATGRRVVVAAADRPNRAAKPAKARDLAAPTIDVQALFEDTMRRYPATMARLAE